MIQDLIYNFLIGGILFSLIYYTANIIQDPGLSAVISLLPISIMCCYLINKKKNVIKHCYKLIPVFLITLFCVGILIYILQKNIFEKNITITYTLILWFILQYLNYKSDIKFP